MIGEIIAAAALGGIGAISNASKAKRENRKANKYINSLREYQDNLAKSGRETDAEQSRLGSTLMGQKARLSEGDASQMGSDLGAATGKAAASGSMESALKGSAAAGSRIAKDTSGESGKEMLGYTSTAYGIDDNRAGTKRRLEALKTTAENESEAAKASKKSVWGAAAEGFASGAASAVPFLK
jgi:hypothetical protein